jgi:hypothetical protein
MAGSLHYMGSRGDRFIKPGSFKVLSNPAIGGVTVKTPQGETPPLRAGRGHPGFSQV